jgi:hypothetical protein
MLVSLTKTQCRPFEKPQTTMLELLQNMLVRKSKSMHQNSHTILCPIEIEMKKEKIS